VVFATGTFHLTGYNIAPAAPGPPISYTLTITPAAAATPEPGAFELLATGLLGLGGAGILRRGPGGTIGLRGRS